jgi:hypothetical protein
MADEKAKFCPDCGRRAAVETGRGAFVEVGEWDGKQYEGEASVTEKECGDCGHLFYD